MGSIRRLPVGLFVLSCCLAASWACGQETQGEAPVVRIALQERLHAPGEDAPRVTGINYPAFFLRKLFDETLGWKVINIYRDRWDRPQEEEGDDDPDAGGGLFGGDDEEEGAQDVEALLALPCDLALSGELTCSATESIFYGEVQAWSFHGSGELRVEDGAGELLATLEVSDDFSRNVRYSFDEASEFCLKRLGRKVLVAVLEAEAVVARIPEDQRAKVQGILRGVQQQLRKQEKPTDEGE